jgi:predicted DCC family thiol-disulfide oxidoreductase YuxK
MRPLEPVAPLSDEDRAFLGRGPVWLFDGVCVLCSRSVRFALAHERPGDAPIRFVAIQSDLGRRLATAWGVDPDRPSSFLWFEDGVAHARSDGALAMARHLGGRARALRLLRFIPRPIRDWLYDRIARNRYALFGKRDDCMIPDAATRARFTLPGSAPDLRQESQLAVGEG